MNEKDSLLSSPQLVHNEQHESAFALSPKQIHSLYKKSKESGFTLETLVQVFSRGYLSEETPAETGVKAGFDRVNSFIHGGEAAELDADLLEAKKHKHHSKKSMTAFVAGQMAKDVASTAFPGAAKAMKCYSTAYKRYLKQDMSENVMVVGEPQSDDPADPSSRFAGTSSLTNILKASTPGQTQARIETIKRVVKDAVVKKDKE